MNKRLYNYLHKKGRSYWFYYHLKHDDDFRKEANELDKKIAIKRENGTFYRPTAIEDFDYLNDPNKETKLGLIEEFQIRWHIHWDYYLLNFLIRGDPEDVPPAGNGLVSLGYREERNMFEAQISPTASKEDFDLLWLMFKSEKKRLGTDMSKKPRKNTFNQRKTEMAYEMWKLLRDGSSWTEVVKHIDDKYSTTYKGHIGDAEDFLKSYGYRPR
jgi:hypothetical protein